MPHQTVDEEAHLHRHVDRLRIFIRVVVPAFGTLEEKSRCANVLHFGDEAPRVTGADLVIRGGHHHQHRWIGHACLDVEEGIPSLHDRTIGRIVPRAELGLHAGADAAVAVAHDREVGHRRADHGRAI
jgi:hypothetical protein